MKLNGMESFIIRRPLLLRLGMYSNPNYETSCGFLVSFFHSSLQSLTSPDFGTRVPGNLLLLGLFPLRGDFSFPLPRAESPPASCDCSEELSAGWGTLHSESMGLFLGDTCPLNTKIAMSRKLQQVMSDLSVSCCNIWLPASLPRKFCLVMSALLDSPVPSFLPSPTFT